MEKHNPKFESLESVADRLETESNFFENSSEYFNYFGKILKNNEDFQTNFDQLILVARQFVFDSTVEDQSASKGFLIGGLFAYNSLVKIQIDDLYENVYTAVNSYIANARLEVNKQLEQSEDEASEHFRNYLVSEMMHNIYEDDLSFEAVDSKEFDQVRSMISDLLSNDAHTNFAMKGYAFIRGILIWYERHKVELLKRYLRDINANEVDHERNFFEIIASVEIDPDLADGKIDCDTEVHILNTYFKKLKNQYRPKENMDDYELNDLLQEMELDITKLMYTFEKLNMFSRFTFDGPNMALIADDRVEFTRFFAFGENSVLEGHIVDVEVRAIPNQATIDRITKAHRNGEDTGARIKLSHYGLVLKIQDAIIVDDDGSVTTFPKHSTVYVPMGMKKTRILRHLIDENDEQFLDTGDDDNYDSDDE